METNDLFPIEEKSCRRRSCGFKNQLFISWLIIKNCKSKDRNLSIAWTDYWLRLGECTI